MDNRPDRTEAQRSESSTSGTRSGLAHLDDLNDYQVAEGEPDIRGWTVRDASGRDIGKVKDLVVDCSAMKARYMEVELDGDALGLDDDRHILMPVGTARLNDDDDVVVARRQASELAALPRYERLPMTAERERTLREQYAGSAAGNSYDNEIFEEEGFFGDRRRGREQARYVALIVNPPDDRPGR
jgi:photosynthetic reaction center H subunit